MSTARSPGTPSDDSAPTDWAYAQQL